MQPKGLTFRSSLLSLRSRSNLVGRFALGLCALLVGTTGFAQIPAVGAKAPDFTLMTPTGTSVELAKQEDGKPLVLVVLRGFPGYQCPYCQKQVHDFVEHASDFSAKNATVLLVYPGPPAELDQRAKEFLAKEAKLPANIVLVTDPDYKMRTCMDCVGMHRTRPRMRPLSSWTRRVRSFLRKPVILMATVSLLRTPLTIFPRGRRSLGRGRHFGCGSCV